MFKPVKIQLCNTGLRIHNGVTIEDLSEIHFNIHAVEWYNRGDPDLRETLSFKWGKREEPSGNMIPRIELWDRTKAHPVLVGQPIPIESFNESFPEAKDPDLWRWKIDTFFHGDRAIAISRYNIGPGGGFDRPIREMNIRIKKNPLGEMCSHDVHLNVSQYWGHSSGRGPHVEKPVCHLDPSAEGVVNCDLYIKLEETG